MDFDGSWWNPSNFDGFWWILAKTVGFWWILLKTARLWTISMETPWILMHLSFCARAQRQTPNRMTPQPHAVSRILPTRCLRRVFGSTDTVALSFGLHQWASSDFFDWRNSAIGTACFSWLTLWFFLSGFIFDVTATEHGLYTITYMWTDTYHRFQEAFGKHV